MSPLAATVICTARQGRPIAIEADGVAVFNAPRGTDVSGPLRVWTRHLPNDQAKLSGSSRPTPIGNRERQASAQGASKRLLMASGHIDAHDRSTKVRIDVGPLSDCGALRLRWEKPIAVVVKALAEQPYADWQDHRLPPTAIPRSRDAVRTHLHGHDHLAGVRPNHHDLRFVGAVRDVYDHGEADADRTRRNVYTISLGGPPLTETTPAQVRLAPGSNVITIDVTAADGNTTNTYTVTVSRESPSTDARLGALVLGGTSPDECTPVFMPGAFEHDVRVPHSTVRTAVLPETTHAAATYAAATDPADALIDVGYTTALVELAEGATTTVNISVTAEDGGTTQDYVVRVHRVGP